jgi:hypothetical protein
MRRWLLGLCLIAYPPSSRRREGAYLRDLALELAERQGLLRQVVSLLAGGVRERAGRPGRWGRRVAAASLAGLALAVGGLAVNAAAQTDHEVGQFACTDSGIGGDSSCAGQARKVIVARERAGWRCTAVGGAATPQRAEWRCTRER